jgi:phenylalanyl-tRNA synthetase beta chain
MNIPMSWLKQYVEINEDIQTYIDTMTLVGQKVEAIEEIGKEITKVVVGKITDTKPHPDADRLRIMQVDIGQNEMLQIVTAASNVNTGDLIPVALEGATLANDLKIKKGKLRGVESQGMFCSVEELGLTSEEVEDAPEDGVYIFKEEMPLGSCVKEYFGLGEQVVEYEVTSNRPDCFSILGIAREAAAAFGRDFHFPNIQVDEVDGDATKMATVTIHNEDLCPRYAARIVQNVKVGPSPKWLKNRLVSAGLRPINNIVDITNYMLLEFGQPMHAFDYDKLEGGIHVRTAKQGEKITTLLGDEVTLEEGVLVIADTKKPVAIAGIMGGEDTKVTEETKTILFECATFDAYTTRQSSKKLGITSDSSKKYVKGLDPNTVEVALDRAAMLINKTGAGEVVKGVIDVYPCKREPLVIPYDVLWINQFLGIDIEESQMVEYFRRLEFVVSEENKTLVIPTFRPDITMMADLAEEVARLYGYDKIMPTLEKGAPTVGVKNFKQKMVDQIKELMSSYGLNEALSYTFESPKVFTKLQINEDSPLREALFITNPLGEDFSMMRTTTLNAMLTSLSTNYNRRNEAARLYEINKVFHSKGKETLPDEIEKLTIGLYGKEVDFFTVKGIVESIVAKLRIEKVTYVRNTSLPFMHPGRCASILIEGREIGFLGEVHPKVDKNYDIGAKAYIVELTLDELVANAKEEISYVPLPKYPATSRDLAMLVKKEVLAAEIEQIIVQRGGKLLEKLELFDVYEGEQVQKGYKSIAYKLTFRATDRTLVEEEIQKTMGKILSGLEQGLDAQLRQ